MTSAPTLCNPPLEGDKILTQAQAGAAERSGGRRAAYEPQAAEACSGELLSTRFSGEQNV